MSRKYNRRAQINRAAYEMLGANLRPCPWFLPAIVWRLVRVICIKIAFV